jgi:hypothetical protein
MLKWCGGAGIGVEGLSNGPVEVSTGAEFGFDGVMFLAIWPHSIAIEQGKEGVIVHLLVDVHVKPMFGVCI